MKFKFIQLCSALILPITFIIILILLNTVPLPALNKYGFGGILIAAIALILTYFFVNKDGYTFKDISFYFEKKTPLRLVKGFVLGVVIATVMLVVVVYFSSLEISINKTIDITSLLIWVLAYFPLAYMEEVIFRGYAFTKITNSVGVWPAQISLAILFAWYHDFTGLTFFQQLLGPGIWALLYGVVTLKSNGIALATGLHAALNIIQALVGLKDYREGIWSLQYPQAINPELQSQTETIGVILQLCVLVVSIYLTEKYRRNRLKNECS